MRIRNPSFGWGLEKIFLDTSSSAKLGVFQLNSLVIPLPIPRNKNLIKNLSATFNQCSVPTPPFPGHLFVKADCIQLMYSPDEWDVPLGLKLLSVCFWGAGGGRAQMSSKRFEHTEPLTHKCLLMLIWGGISPHDSPVGGRKSHPLTSGAIWALQSVKFQFLHQSFACQT